MVVVGGGDVRWTPPPCECTAARGPCWQLLPPPPPPPLKNADMHSVRTYSTSYAKGVRGQAHVSAGICIIMYATQTTNSSGILSRSTDLYNYIIIILHYGFGVDLLTRYMAIPSFLPPRFLPSQA